MKRAASTAAVWQVGQRDDGGLTPSAMPTPIARKRTSMKNRPSIITHTDSFPGPRARRVSRGASRTSTTTRSGSPSSRAAIRTRPRRTWLARTERLTVATGIANVYSHDAVVAAQNRQTLAELSGGRFVLGLGVSHPPMAQMHGLDWVPPFRKMREYLDTMDATRVDSPAGPAPAPIWLAANGPKLLGLVAERLDGANTYLLPPAHTKKAREILGPDKRLTVVLPCCLCEDPVRARKIARAALSIYMPLPAYQKEWGQLGLRSLRLGGRWKRPADRHDRGVG